MKKKLAIIGCGGIGAYHLGHFLEFHDIELAGFCDLIPERAQSFADQAGCGKVFTDYKKMYDDVRPDMVFICIPPYCHGEIEYETIRRRIPFFVEKPLSLDLELARDIRNKVREAGLITASGFQCRYSNLTTIAQSFAQNHEIVHVQCARIGGVPGVFWWKKRSLSGGQIVEQTIHQFDMIRYICGEPDTVFTMGARGYVKDIEGYDTDDISSTVVRFANGMLATITTGCYASSGDCFDSKITFGTRDAHADMYILDKLDLYGVTENTAASENQDNGLVIKNDGRLSTGGGKLTYHQEGDAGILCDRTFIDAVLSGDPSKIKSSYEDAFRSLNFTLACNRSMDTGMPVKIDND